MQTKTLFCVLILLNLVVYGLICSEGRVSEHGPSINQPGFVTKVMATSGNVTDTGSGVLVREDLVVTCYHVVRDAIKRGDPTIEVSVGPNGDLRTAKVERTDPGHDLALLRIPVVLNVPAQPGARPERGDSITVCGFPGGVYYSEIRGKVVGFSSHSRKGRDNDIMRVSRTTRGGMSGGPALNEDGELVGILFGSRAYSNITDIDAVRKFMSLEEN